MTARLHLVPPAPHQVPYSERAFYDGEPCHHCGRYDEYLKEKRANDLVRRAGR
jgi:hypothetical protein